MKVALLGRGKTGSHVAKLCEERGIPCEIFHSQRPLTLEDLTNCDIVISFIPGKHMLDYLPILLEGGRPIISGATGVDFPDDLGNKLKEKGISWVQGHNFSLGMTIVTQLFKVLNKAPQLFPDSWQAKIHEIHHTKKLDAPSGTALRWGEWFGHETKMTSERTGDVVGHHEFTFSVPYETITLTHNAEDRSLFANGALWAAQNVLEGKTQAGLTWFEDLATKELKI